MASGCTPWPEGSLPDSYITDRMFGSRSGRRTEKNLPTWLRRTESFRSGGDRWMAAGSEEAIYANDAFTFCIPIDWSPDGKYLSMHMSTKEEAFSNWKTLVVRSAACGPSSVGERKSKYLNIARYGFAR